MKPQFAMAVIGNAFKEPLRSFPSGLWVPTPHHQGVVVIVVVVVVVVVATKFNVDLFLFYFTGGMYRILPICCFYYNAITLVSHANWKRSLLYGHCPQTHRRATF
eukprot:3996076-Amphidinium_carterae.1